MKKLLKILAIGIFALLLTGVATIVFLSRKPAPEAICNNLFELSLAEMNRAAAQATGQDPETYRPLTRQDVEGQMKMTLAQCVEDVERRWAMSTRPGIQVAKQARCEAKAKSLKEMEDC